MLNTDACCICMSALSLERRHCWHFALHALDRGSDGPILHEYSTGPHLRPQAFVGTQHGAVEHHLCGSGADEFQDSG